MPKRSVLILQNIPREGPGIIRDVLGKNNIQPVTVDLSQSTQIPQIEDFAAVVVMGGPDSANDKTPKMRQELALVKSCLDQQIPYIGVCLGMQALVKSAGGKVMPGELREVGFTGPDGRTFKVSLTGEGRSDPLFNKLGDEFAVFHLHGETVKPSENVQLLAEGNFVRNQIIKVGPNAYGIQSHFELTDQMLKRWLNEDPWLQELNPEKIRKQFAQIKEEYTQTAWQLFTNFLRIANLV